MGLMNDGSSWPTDKLTALRLGRRLVAEAPASGQRRRAFVDVSPKKNGLPGSGSRSAVPGRWPGGVDASVDYCAIRSGFPE